jgi:hypothetical protein
MIWDSAPWKDGLLKDADTLDRWAPKTRRTGERSVIFEKKIFGAAYAIRKLFEADKVCTSLQDKPVPCVAHPRTSDLMSPWSWHHVDEHFDLTIAPPARLGANALVNQIIHSHVFLLQVDDQDRIVGFLVSSRQGKRQRLFGINLTDYCALMREVGTDYPTESRTMLDDANGQYHTTNTCPTHGGKTQVAT